ncbi:clindamycin resistance transfer factor BtgB [Bacteroides fragilis]|nr:clindamycin resistance transfer factor BtgB [Bacteroides fragilis]MCE8764132.1 clindamycin resistance transfer factor BtgB [Bacteroides fragilis]
MHIDFAPPSNGTYNNAGSCRQLTNYMEHEDLERMEKGIYTEGFFNLTEDNIYKSAVIKDIDSNIGQLLKTDAKFYAIHVSPSESELRAMGNTEQKQAEAMKRYIREVFILEYAKNFNKGLSETDIKFYGKVHFDRNRSDNELNMHCHLIVSRKDQTNKKKLSPLTNHKNTKNGIIKGGFDRVSLFQQVEQGFDKLFGYNRQLTESFEYYNTMKNDSIFEQLDMLERQIGNESRNTVIQIELNENKQNNILTNIQLENQESKNEEKQIFSIPNLGLSSVLDLLTHESNDNDEQQIPVKRKKKKLKRGFRR